MRIVAILEIITAIGLVIFWTAFFTIGLTPENAPHCYTAFEHSFPLPDMVLAFALLMGGIFTLKQRAIGKVFSLAAAGGLMFLGLVDFSFNIQNGMYSLSMADLLMNAFINIWSFGFGLVIFLSVSRLTSIR